MNKIQNYVVTAVASLAVGALGMLGGLRVYEGRQPFGIENVVENSGEESEIKVPYIVDRINERQAPVDEIISAYNKMPVLEQKISEYESLNASLKSEISRKDSALKDFLKGYHGIQE